MDEIVRIHDKFFKQVFKDEKNMQALLRSCLPPALNDAIDYKSMQIDPTNYISPHFDEGYSDLVAKTRIRTKNKKNEFLPLDLYVLVEHKSYVDTAIFIQLLWYMVLKWQEDIRDKKPLRLIIPLVFYHGESKWTIPTSFVEQFDVDEELKKYLLDFRYILFDTSGKDLWDEKNRDLRENLYFFSSLVTMKNAYIRNRDGLKNMFRLWLEQGFFRNREVMDFVLIYLTQTGDIDRETLEKMMNESKLDGGAIMESLYQQIEREVTQKVRQEVRKEERQDVVRTAFEKGFPDDQISDLTGFSMDEIGKIKNAWLSTKKSDTSH